MKPLLFPFLFLFSSFFIGSFGSSAPYFCPPVRGGSRSVPPPGCIPTPPTPFGSVPSRPSRPSFDCRLVRIDRPYAEVPISIASKFLVNVSLADSSLPGGRREYCFQLASFYFQSFSCGFTVHAYYQFSPLVGIRVGENYVSLSPSRDRSRLCSRCACVLSLRVCRSFPHKSHSRFVDTWGELHSGSFLSDQACFQRARDWFFFCGNVGGTSEQVQATRCHHSQEFTLFGCFISLASCAHQPHLSGRTIRDDWGHIHLQTDKHVDRCLARAKDYYQWCGNSQPVQQRIRAHYFPAALKVTTRVESAPASSFSDVYPKQGCYVQIDHCRKYPSFSQGRPVRDHWGETHRQAALSASACLARAFDYFQWCDSTNGVAAQVVTMHYLPSVQTFAVASLAQQTEQACYVVLRVCLNHPHLSKTTQRDHWGELHVGAALSKDRCARRAQSYFQWCGNTNDSQKVGTIYTSTGEYSLFPPPLQQEYTVVLPPKEAPPQAPLPQRLFFEQNERTQFHERAIEWLRGFHGTNSKMPDGHHEQLSRECPSFEQDTAPALAHDHVKNSLGIDISRSPEFLQLNVPSSSSKSEKNQFRQLRIL